VETVLLPIGAEQVSRELATGDKGSTIALRR
jgi:hypothetical protein